jgi:hypothetical protein
MQEFCGAEPNLEPKAKPENRFKQTWTASRVENSPRLASNKCSSCAECSSATIGTLAAGVPGATSTETSMGSGRTLWTAASR